MVRCDFDHDWPYGQLAWAAGQADHSDMTQHEWFELQRQSDELIYSFRRGTHPGGGEAYQRQDQDLWIRFRPGLGWVAWDEASQSCMGRPWDVQPHEQGDHPPEGVWVSRKGNKSYVYRLVYVDGPADAGTS